ncbi:AmmeMemoRadiSam system protein B [bacterium]|nr:AmmeMemoRadiSam system protein B [bacterium]
MKIKPKSSGVFFPDSKKDILKCFDEYHRRTSSHDSNLIIVPHAGYEFSGKIAFNTYSYLTKTFKNTIVIAPALYSKVYGTLSSNAEAFKTPLGNIPIKPYPTDIDNTIFKDEAALTVQLPFIKYFFPNSSITPILYGCEDFENITRIIEENISQNAIVIVSNLSRFIPEKEALRLDTETARKIDRLQTQDLDMELADGAVGICAAIKYAQRSGKKFILTEQSNSAKYNNDTSSVVGYGGWYLSQ